jgi:hypothetical protein
VGGGGGDGVFRGYAVKEVDAEGDRAMTAAEEGGIGLYRALRGGGQKQDPQEEGEEGEEGGGGRGGREGEGMEGGLSG